MFNEILTKNEQRMKNSLMMNGQTQCLEGQNNEHKFDNNFIIAVNDFPDESKGTTLRDGILGHHNKKDSSLLLHAIHSPFYWRILKNPYSSLVFKILTKTTAKQENSSFFHE